MTRHLDFVSRVFSTISIALGARNSTIWDKILRIYIIVNDLLYLFMLVWTFVHLDADSNIVEKFEMGASIGSDFIAPAFYLTIMRYSAEYESLIEWCESLHHRSYLDAGCFAKAAQKSTKFFKILSFYTPIGVFVVLFGSLIVSSIIEGQIVPAAPMILPFLSHASTLHQTLVTVIQLGMIFPVVTGFHVSFGISTVVIFYFLAAFDALKQLLNKLNVEDSGATFKQKLKQIVCFHNELLEQQENLFDLISYLVMLIDGMSFFLLLYVWVIVFYMPSEALVAFDTTTTIVIYLLMCWLNDKLDDASSDLKTALYDIKWYEMSVAHQKDLLQIMVQVEQPKLLTAGPFDVISFEKYKNMLNQVYSYGLIINDFIQVN